MYSEEPIVGGLQSDVERMVDVAVSEMHIPEEQARELKKAFTERAMVRSWRRLCKAYIGKMLQDLVELYVHALILKQCYRCVTILNSCSHGTCCREGLGQGL